MAHYRTTIWSKDSPESAFAYLSDFAHSAEWDPGVIEARRLDEGPVHLGSNFELVTRFGRRRMTLHYVVTSLEWPRHIEFTAEGGRFRVIDRITFAAAGGGTDVTYDARVHLHGAFVVGAPVVRPMFSRMANRARQGLTRVLNS